MIYIQDRVENGESCVTCQTVTFMKSGSVIVITTVSNIHIFEKNIPAVMSSLNQNHFVYGGLKYSFLAVFLLIQAELACSQSVVSYQVYQEHSRF